MLVRILQMESRDPRVPENCDFCTESETMTSGRPYLRPQAWPSYAQVLSSRVGLSDMRGSSSALVLWSTLSQCSKCPHPPHLERLHLAAEHKDSIADRRDIFWGTILEKTRLCVYIFVIRLRPFYKIVPSAFLIQVLQVYGTRSRCSESVTS
jgi:hypothetical protein